MDDGKIGVGGSNANPSFQCLVNSDTEASKLINKLPSLLGEWETPEQSCITTNVGDLPPFDSDSSGISLFSVEKSRDELLSFDFIF